MEINNGVNFCAKLLFYKFESGSVTDYGLVVLNKLTASV
jgi:hypothetical protein